MAAGSGPNVIYCLFIGFSGGMLCRSRVGGVDGGVHFFRLEVWDGAEKVRCRMKCFFVLRVFRLRVLLFVVFLF
jgi:hypothetical protein